MIARHRGRRHPGGAAARTAPGTLTALPTRAPIPAALRRRLAAATALVLALTGLVVFALVEASRFGSPSGSSTLATVTSPGFVKLPGRAAPSFLLPDLRRPSVSVSLKSLTGRPLVLNFWSTSCTVCVAEAPALAQAYRRLGSRLEFVGIDTAEVSRRAPLAFVDRYRLGYEMLYDGSLAVAGRYTTGLPVTFFVSPAGKLVAENLGAITALSLEHEAKQLFGISPD